MQSRTDKAVIDAWSRNSDPWTAAVRGNEIASRVLVTNAAIVEAVRARRPRTGVDLGCGEGWLVRALPEVEMVGVDAIAELVEGARAAGGGGSFRQLSYEQIAAGELQMAADVAVCNFSLIGEGAVRGLLQAAPGYLRAGGHLIVQTVHPLMACGEAPYVDGWRDGSWAGFNSAFRDAAPWYFRTVGSWLALLVACGLRVVELREPLHPETGKPASLILVAELPARA